MRWKMHNGHYLGDFDPEVDGVSPSSKRIVGQDADLDPISQFIVCADKGRHVGAGLCAYNHISNAVLGCNLYVFSILNKSQLFRDIDWI